MHIPTDQVKALLELEKCQPREYTTRYANGPIVLSEYDSARIQAVAKQAGDALSALNSNFGKSAEEVAKLFQGLSFTLSNVRMKPPV